ncbi:hypothetical protein BDR04DRAFT_938149, partial [Suillus decipiens]
TDSFQGECEHQRVKQFYPQVSKAKFTAGIAKQQCHECLLFKMAKASPHGKNRQDKQDSELLPYSDPQSHYHISTGTWYPVSIYKWLRQHMSDPA